MGAIQNSVNNVLGTAGTVAAISQHLTEQKVNNKINAIKTADELKAAEIDAAKEAAAQNEEIEVIKKDQSVIKDTIKEQKKELKKFKDPEFVAENYPEIGTPGGEASGSAASAEKALKNDIKEGNKDLRALKKAMQMKQNKIDAIHQEQEYRQQHIAALEEIANLRGGKL